MRGRQRGLVALLILAAAPLATAIGADVTAMEPIFVTARMPDYKVTHEDAYLCTAVPLPDQALKLVGVEPLAKQEIAHHMLLFGCESPASKQPVWDCHMRSPCGAGPENTISHGEHVLYGWGKDAPAMHLPPGAGFSVGPRTGIRTAILQVHYQIVRPEGDHTGVRLELTPEAQPFSAGMFTYASGFVVPPRQPAYHVPASCCYAGWEQIRAFAFRVHAHSLGRQIWMDREAMGPRPQERVVGQDPQLPQGFYPVTEGVRFLPGDQLTVTCEFDSTSRDRPTYAGSTSKDEMCNMYMMTYSELPVFMTCGGGQSWYQVDGPGGIPPGTSMAPESPAVWRPPPSVGAIAIGGDELAFGQVAGVAHSLDGETLWVIHRGPRVWDERTYAPGGERLSAAVLAEGPISVPTVVQLHKETGRVMQAWGQGALYLPHSVVTDRDGNVWVTDTGLHQVLKFSEDGKQLLTLGEALTPGHDASHFCKPTAVAFARSGDFFVADGYCNSRVLRYSPDGAMIREYTLPKKALNVPHSLVVDDCANALYVADRENAAVQRFALEDGRHERSVDLRRWGPVYAITMGPYGTLLALCWRRGGDEPLVSVLHINPYEGDRVINEWPLEGVDVPHDLTISSAPLRITGSGERMLAVYVAETRTAGSQLHKLILLHRGLSVTAPDAAAFPADASVAADGDTQPSSDASSGKDAVADGDSMHVDMDQDLSQPPQYEVEDAMSLQDAVWRMFMLGGPFALAFAAIAVVLWRRMSTLSPQFQFQPVSSHEV